MHDRRRLPYPRQRAARQLDLAERPTWRLAIASAAILGGIALVLASRARGKTAPQAQRPPDTRE
ncbi:hypothetical protein WK81_02965 [Burkholderia ubonensis]|nr:hypothetical protein WK81_02965 [Burkholderia ubonensis]